MRPVTDPDLLARLERGDGKTSASSNGLRPVTDPNLLRQLNSEPSDQSTMPDEHAQALQRLFMPLHNTPASALMQQGIEVGKNPVGRAAEEVWASIPFGLGGGLEALGSRLAARGISQGAQRAADVAGMLGKNAAFGAGASAVDPNMEGSLQDRLTGGAEGGVAAGLTGKLTGELIERLRPSRLFRGELAPEELKKNLAITQGTQTGLGDVIESPSMKFGLENLLRYIPGSGVNASLAKTGKEIAKRAENIVSGQSSGAPYNLQQKITDSLKEASEKQRVMKQKLYAESNKMADKSGLKLDLPKFSSSAKKYIDSINDSSLLQHEPEAKSLLSRLVNYTNPVKQTRKTGMLVDKAGNPLVDEITESRPSLKEANILASKLNELGNKHLSSPAMADRSKGSVLVNLGKSLKSDIKNTIKNSENPDLIKSFSDAEKNYGKNYSGFLDKDIYQFTHGNKDPQDILNSFIKTGSTNDKSLKLSKLMDKLPQEGQDLIRHSYLSRAIKGSEDDRYVDPRALANLWSDNKLGMEQKKALFPNKIHRKMLDNFVELVKKNPKSMDLMFNPATGHSNLLGNAIELIGSSPAGILGKVVGAKALSKSLTSESLRNSIVQKMLENKRLEGGNIGAGVLQALQEQLRRGQ